MIENFWSSSVSKTTFQAFYIEWLTTNYSGSKPLYLGISPQAWVVSAGRAALFPRLNCTHEEADDRIMFHVQDITSHRSGPTSLTLSSGDTDVFMCLLYHFMVNWPPRTLAHLQFRGEKNPHYHSTISVQLWEMSLQGAFQHSMC